MPAAILVVLRSFALIYCGHRAVALENLALRQTVGGVQARGPASATPSARSTVLAAARSRVAELAFGLDRRATRDGGRLASAMAPTAMDPPVDVRSSWPAPHHDGHSDARRPDGRGEPAVGRASDPWGIEEARRRRLRANRLAALAEARSPTVTDLAHLPDESRDVPGVDGLLHGADAQRPRVVRAGATRPPPPPNRPRGDHQTSHWRMDGATGHRGLSERQRAAVALAGSRCHLWGRVSGAVSPAWPSRRSSPVPQVLGKTRMRRD